MRSFGLRFISAHYRYDDDRLPIRPYFAPAAVREEDVTGPHPGQQVTDDEPGDNLDNCPRRPVRSDARRGQEEAQGGAYRTSRNAPENDEDHDPAQEPAFVTRGWTGSRHGHGCGRDSRGQERVHGRFCLPGIGEARG